MRKQAKSVSLFLLASLLAIAAIGCAKTDNSAFNNLANEKDTSDRIVNLFSPSGKTKLSKNSAAFSALEKTTAMAEEQLGLTIEFHSYTAEDYQDESYDDVVLKRVRSSMDDFYLINPDTIQILGSEGSIADLSGLACTDNLRDVVKTANTVNGKLVAIPQEIVAYGLFLNQDLFNKYQLTVPNTPEELLACCKVFKENGIDTPIGANRWWLECFVLAQGYADLYNNGNTDEEIAAINNGTAKLSDYMRPGFEFLQTLIDEGYIDAKAAYTYEAIEGEGEAFKNQETPIVMAYWGAANAEQAYGNLDFTLKVIGFPSDLGQMPVVSLTGYAVATNAQHYEDAMDVLDVMLSDEALLQFAETNQVISPSKNVSVDYKDALKPLGELVNDDVYVLGSNPNLNVEQWGNICLIVRDLLNGASVDECMAKFDQLQQDNLSDD